MNTSLKIVGLAAIFSLASCVSTNQPQKILEPKDPDIAKVKELDSNWTHLIPKSQPEIRACLISQKMTKKIRYVTAINKNETMVLIDDDLKVQNCRVNTQNYQVIAIEPYTEMISDMIPKFIPIGRQMASCNNPGQVLDDQRRLMGTICR